LTPGFCKSFLKKRIDHHVRDDRRAIDLEQPMLLKNSENKLKKEEIFKNIR